MPSFCRSPHRTWWPALAAALLLFLWTAVAAAAEFSARLVAKVQGREQRGQVFVKGDKIRQAMEMEGGPAATIVRPEKRVLWLLFPLQKTYLEMPFSPEEVRTFLILPRDRSRWRLMGTGTLQGYAVEQYEVPMTLMGRETKALVWLAPKLNAPLKMTLNEGAVTIEYLDVKEGPLQDALFDIPAGYQRTTLPALMPQEGKSPRPGKR
jgi:hypothetical protein